MLNFKNFITKLLIDPIYEKETEEFLIQFLKDKQTIINSLEWMVAAMKWKADEIKLNIEEGSQGGYSPQLTKAINLLKELQNECKN